MKFMNHLYVYVSHLFKPPHHKEPFSCYQMEDTWFSISLTFLVNSPDEAKDQAVKYLKKLYFMLLQLFRISSLCMCTHT